MLRNLALLLAAVLPAWIAVMFLVSLIFPVAWVEEEGFRWTPGQLFQALIFWWLIMVIPVGIGGVLHQFIVAWLPSKWPRRRVRAAAVLSAPVVYLVLGLTSPSTEFLLSPRVLLPALLATFAYGWLLHPPRDEPAVETAPTPRATA